MGHPFGNLNKVLNPLTAEIKACTDNHWLVFFQTKMLPKNSLLLLILTILGQVNPIWNRNNGRCHSVRFNQFLRVDRWGDDKISLLIHVGQVFAHKRCHGIGPDKRILKILFCRVSVHNNLFPPAFSRMEQHEGARTVGIDMDHIVIAQNIGRIGNTCQIEGFHLMMKGPANPWFLQNGFSF